MLHRYDTDLNLLSIDSKKPFDYARKLPKTGLSLWQEQEVKGEKISKKFIAYSHLAKDGAEPPVSFICLVFMYVSNSVCF